MPEGPAGDRLVRIAQELLTHPIEDITPERVVELAIEHVPGCTLASITLRRAGQLIETPAASDLLAERLDQWQYEIGDGPCVNTLRDGTIRLCDDLTTESRWPGWSRRAAEAGIASVLSFQLATPERVLGSLNLYGKDRNAFTADSVDIGAVYARMASGALFTAHQNSGLRNAVESRNIIGIAQGLLMNRYGLTRNQSFEVLRRRSQESNTKLRDLAATMVEQWDRVGARSPSQHV